MKVASVQSMLLSKALRMQ
jgi:hypothetical protein